MEEINAVKARISLSNYQQHFRNLDRTTLFARLLCLPFFFPTEPENIESILAIDLKSYSVLAKNARRA